MALPMLLTALSIKLCLLAEAADPGVFFVGLFFVADFFTLPVFFAPDVFFFGVAFFLGLTLFFTPFGLDVALVEAVEVLFLEVLALAGAFFAGASAEAELVFLDRGVRVVFAEPSLLRVRS